jgi:hypothetical protein
VPFNGGDAMGATPCSGAWGGDPVQCGRRQLTSRSPTTEATSRQHAHAASTKIGEVGAARWGPSTFPGGGVKWFEPFPNSNGSKMFKFF